MKFPVPQSAGVGVKSTLEPERDVVPRAPFVSPVIVSCPYVWSGSISLDFTSTRTGVLRPVASVSLTAIGVSLRQVNANDAVAMFESPPEPSATW